MKFYDRDNEMQILRQIADISKANARMTFVTGRRRTGKTSLLTKSFEFAPSLYFFVARKNEALLCQEYLDEIKAKLSVEVYGTFKQFKDIFAWLMELSKSRNFTLIIDEFQDFYSVNPSVFSEMQNIWDNQKEGSKINLILCGSAYSLMRKIFENSKEPLFGRATNRINLKEFNTTTVKEILKDHYPDYTSDDLLAFYMVSGGVAKYVELLVDLKAFTFDKIMDEFFSFNSIFIDEGKNSLIDEFGKDYGNYFSILSLIATSKTSRTEIESILEMQAGGFLERLEKDFGLIHKIKPIFSKPGSRSLKYQINDNFLNFWFRYIYKNRSAVEIGNYEYLKNVVRQDYTTFSGKILEKYFTEKLKESGNYSLIGNYWEKENRNEIDIIAVNENEKNMLIAEVKRNSNKINLNELQLKSKNILMQFSDYNIQFKAFSLNEM